MEVDAVVEAENKKTARRRGVVQVVRSTEEDLLGGNKEAEGQTGEGPG